MNETAEKDRKARFQTITMLVLLVGGIGIFLLLQTNHRADPQSGSSRIEKGAMAPDFAFPDQSGKTIRLSDYKGKVVFLNIWATWCPSCVDEMPSVEKLYQALKDESFEMVAVSIDASGAGVVGPFMTKYKLNFTALTDPRGTIKSLYHTTGVPETFIIDTNGKIAEKFIGPRDWATPETIRRFRDWIRSQ